ncbi:hypothetical protein D3C71_1756830 [compost metagenome]
MPRGAERARDEQQRIAGQEGHDDQPRLRKDNQEQHQVHPHAILRDPDAQRLVDVEHHIEKFKHQRPGVRKKVKPSRL